MEIFFYIVIFIGCCKIIYLGNNRYMYFCVQIKYFMRTDKMRVTTHKERRR